MRSNKETPTRKLKVIAAPILTLAMLLSACGGTTTQHEMVGAAAAYELTQQSPAGMVVLDVRTPEEYAEARVDGAVLLDFYSPSFRDQLAELDRDVPYFVYCRSGNRSTETVSLMRDLGFAEVYELEGGILSWAQQGLPLVSS